MATERPLDTSSDQLAKRRHVSRDPESAGDESSEGSSSDLKRDTTTRPLRSGEKRMVNESTIKLNWQCHIFQSLPVELVPKQPQKPRGRTVGAPFESDRLPSWKWSKKLVKALAKLSDHTVNDMVYAHAMLMAHFRPQPETSAGEATGGGIEEVIERIKQVTEAGLYKPSTIEPQPPAQRDGEVPLRGSNAGKKPGEILGKTPYQLIPKKWHPREQDQDHQISFGGPVVTVWPTDLLSKMLELAELIDEGKGHSKFLMQRVCFQAHERMGSVGPIIVQDVVKAIEKWKEEHPE